MKKSNYIVAIGYVIFFLLYKMLILSLIMNCIPVMRNHSDLAILILNIIDIMSIIIVLSCFKINISRGNAKSYLKGIGVYGIVIVVFSIFYSVQAICWIFSGHIGLYGQDIIIDVVINLFLYITVGIEEEMIFRGVVLKCIFDRKNSETKVNKKYNVILGCLYSGILFGLAHIENFIFDVDTPIIIVLCTIIFGICIGFVFAVIYLRTKSIWAVVSLHFLWDFSEYSNHMMIIEKYRYSGSYNFLLRQIPVIIIMMIIAIAILLKNDEKKLLDMYNKREVKEYVQ